MNSKKTINDLVNEDIHLYAKKKGSILKWYLEGDGTGKY